MFSTGISVTRRARENAKWDDLQFLIAQMHFGFLKKANKYFENCFFFNFGKCL